MVENNLESLLKILRAKPSLSRGDLNRIGFSLSFLNAYYNYAKRIVIKKLEIKPKLKIIASDKRITVLNIKYEDEELVVTCPKCGNPGLIIKEDMEIINSWYPSLDCDFCKEHISGRELSDYDKYSIYKKFGIDILATIAMNDLGHAKKFIGEYFDKKNKEKRLEEKRLEEKRLEEKILEEKILGKKEI